MMTLESSQTLQEWQPKNIFITGKVKHLGAKLNRILVSMNGHRNSVNKCQSKPDFES